MAYFDNLHFWFVDDRPSTRAPAGSSSSSLPSKSSGCGSSACLTLGLSMASAAAAAVGGTIHTDHRYRSNLNASPTYNHNTMSDRWRSLVRRSQQDSLSLALFSPLSRAASPRDRGRRERNENLAARVQVRRSMKRQKRKRERIACASYDKLKRRRR